MKINKIEFCNLNSLKGYWCIDLTSPEYAKNHNQFVIHGETGSGKTTILDAITLALYGKTPRLSNQNKENQNIITKHTDSCMASVTYECKGNTYKSTFELKRRENKPFSFHVLNLNTNEDSGAITDYKKIEAFTQNIIQLGYEQFCRSILLAQGKFDTFISGTEQERADILEKMCGVDYKDIGNQIWLKANKIVKKYENKQKEIETVVILSDEELEALQKEQNEIPKNNKALQKEIDINKEAINWLDQLQILLNEKEEAVVERKKYEEDAAVFAEKKNILEKGEKALNCNAAYEKYSQLKSADEVDRKKQSEKTGDIKKLDEKIASQKAVKEEAEKKHKEFGEKKAENLKLWNKVRDLDIKIGTGEKTVKEAKEREDTAYNEYKKKDDRNREIIEKIKNNQKEIDGFNNYLSENSKDSKLEKIISDLRIKLESAENSLANKNDAEAQLTSAKELKVEIKKELDKNYEELTQADKNLKSLVSTEYLSISLMLRTTLEHGKACPVCGALEHPSCGDASENQQTDEGKKAGEVAEKVSVLNSQIEKLKDNIIELNNKKTSNEEVIRQAEKTTGKEKKVLEGIQEKVNATIVDWNFSINLEKDADDFAKLIEDLVKKDAEYQNAEKQKLLLQGQNDSLNSELTGMNVTALKETWEKLQKETEGKQAEVDKLADERKKMFGENDPDMAQKDYENELESLRCVAESEKDALTELNTQKTKVDGELRQLNEAIEGRKEPLTVADGEYQKALKDNGFAAEEEFLKCRCSSEELSELKKKAEQLNTDDASTNTKVEESKKKYDAFKKQNKTDKTKAELNELNGALEEKKTKNSERNGEIQDKLKTNNQNIEKRTELENEVKDLKEKAEIWETIRDDYIGVRDGKKFQIFVQALVVRNLLNKANKYLEMISGKYKLVQVPEKVDFMVHDENFPDAKEDRPVSAMSGGERFVISLCLALGIAELASKNVKIDSMFLDEGFGTLSGQTLYESINALKALQTSGKMLGIITHVTEVIDSFEQKIEASPLKRNGGYSQLQGAGITHLDQIPS